MESVKANKKRLVANEQSYFVSLRSYTFIKHVDRLDNGNNHTAKTNAGKERIVCEMNSAAYASFPSQSMHELFKLIKIVKKNLHKVNVPTLILHALEDDVASIKNANYIEKNIGTHLVRKVLLDDTYHMLPLDNQKDRVAEETISFFKQNIHANRYY